MKFIAIQILIAGIVLALQATSSTYTDVVSILGLGVLLLTLFGGFAKIVSKITTLQATVDEQTKAMARQDKKIEEMCRDMKEMSKQINQVEKDMIHITR